MARADKSSLSSSVPALRAVTSPVDEQRGAGFIAEGEPHPRRFATTAVRRALWLVLVAVLVAAAVLAARHFERERALPQGLLQVSGRIEGDSVVIASKSSGRIQTLLAREGDMVRAGQVLAVLDDGTARARVAQATAARDVARARLAAARAALGVFRREVPLQSERARAAVATADASLTRALAADAQARRDRDRARQLFESKAVAREALEGADLAVESSGAAISLARAARVEAAQALTDAKLGSDRVVAREADVRALEAGVRQTEAQLEEAQTALADLEIHTPVAGTVITRFMDAGEVISAGSPLLEVVDLDRLYLKVFIPEYDIGKAHLGLPARIYTDAFPSEFFAARLGYLSSRAEFTPKEVQTRDERTKLVYAAKIYVADNSTRRLSPGQSGDAIIRWQEGAPWSGPRW